MNAAEQREILIAGLMNPDLSPVVDFEKSYKDCYVYGCDRAHATRLADRIIAEGSVKRSMQIMSDDALRANVRKLNIEDRARKVAQQEKADEEGRALHAPRPMSDADNFAMRGGNPGGWFDANESAYDGGVSYRQSGQPVREEMERRVRSAFATH
jgi:hypothetical protein